MGRCDTFLFSIVVIHLPTKILFVYLDDDKWLRNVMKTYISEQITLEDIKDLRKCELKEGTVAGNNFTKSGRNVKPTEKAKAASNTVKKKKSDAADLGEVVTIKEVPVKKVTQKAMMSNRNERLMKRVNAFTAASENKVLILYTIHV